MTAFHAHLLIPAVALSLTALLPGCRNDSPPPRQQSPQANRSNDQGDESEVQDARTAAERQIQKVIDESIELLETEQYRQWAKRFTPEVLRGPEVLDQWEQSLRDKPERTRELIAALREARSKSPTFNAKHNEAYVPIPSLPGGPGEIVFGEEPSGWVVRQLRPAESARRQAGSPTGGAAKDNGPATDLKRLGIALHNYHETQGTSRG